MSIHILLALAIIFFVTGCTATKQATASNSLKGNDVGIQAPSGVEEISDPGFTTLGALTDQFARDFSAQCRQKQKIFLDRASIREANTNDVANLSSTLENELEASLSRKFQLVYEPEEADYLLVAVFQSYGKMLRIFFKLHDNVDLSGTKSMDYSIDRTFLPEDSLIVNLHSKAAQLAADIIGQEYGRKIYIQPVELDSCNCVSDFSRSFSSLLKTEIVRMYRTVEIIDEKPVKARLADTRGLQEKAKKVEKPYSADGVHPVFYPSQLYTIPAPEDDFELEVELPYGLDAVKIFASPVKLPVPRMTTQAASRSYSRGVRAITKKRKDIQEQLAGSTSINPKDLVDYYRGLKQRFHTEILEDSLVVETQP